MITLIELHRSSLNFAQVPHCWWCIACRWLLPPGGCGSIDGHGTGQHLVWPNQALGHLAAVTIDTQGTFHGLLKDVHFNEVGVW